MRGFHCPIAYSRSTPTGSASIYEAEEYKKTGADRSPTFFRKFELNSFYFSTVCASMQRYEYSELDSDGREIRLMTLLPRADLDEIHVTLRNLTLDPTSPPSYEALSYTWGSTRDTVPIRISTVTGEESAVAESKDWSEKHNETSNRPFVQKYSVLEVTRNLAVALEHLQYDREPRVLWIDAICINQQDMQERSSQVQRMGDIYQLARQTTVWLGPEEYDSCLAIETLDDLASRITVDWSTLTCLAIGENENDVALADLDKDLPFDQQQLTSVIRLLERPWFERLWIRQEVQLAKSAVVVCGFNSLHWDRFRDLCFRLWHGGYLGELLAEQIYGSCLYDSREEQSSYDSLFYNLWMTKRCKCSDQRDRIYALTNISSLPRIYPPEEQQIFKPDYGKDVCSVFQEFVLREIEGSRMLHTLLFCDLQEALPNAPSWVPNIPASIPDYNMSNLGAAGLTVTQAIHQGNGILEVSGAFISTIGDVIPVNSPGAGWLNSSYGDRCNEMRRLALLILASTESNMYPSGVSLLEAFCRTIYCNSFAELYYPRTPGVALFQDAFDELSIILNESGDNSTRSDVKTYLTDQQLRSRNFFTTSEGYIGLAPSAARSGDQVSVLLGCRAPVVLRPRSDGYFVVVGQCYIHGFGDGEALLGPLPAGWSRVDRGRKGNSYMDRATGILRLTDPRLGDLPYGWRMVSYSSDDQPPRFVDVFTRKSTYEDPRQTPEALRARGVDLRTILLK